MYVDRQSGYPSFDEFLHGGRLTSAFSPLPQFLVLTLRFKSFELVSFAI